MGDLNLDVKILYCDVSRDTSHRRRTGLMISQTAEYALRAVVWLASSPDRAHGTPQIATAVKVPAGYLAKVMQRLARAGLVVSSPGRLGGFRIARPATEISVFDVVNAVDPIRRIHTCPLG
jgi:Rrf2 family transcriptional regulator, nitric oxide-sensitive transcriptional repressor